MNILIGLSAGLYLILGNYFWRVIVMRPIDERHLRDVRTKEQLFDVIDQVNRLTEGEQTQSFTHQFIKASFLLLWPAILIGGKITATLIDWNR